MKIIQSANSHFPAHALSPEVAEYTIHSVSVTEQDGLTRLDKFVAQQFPDFSRTFFQHLIDQGCVWVNGGQAKKSSLTARPGDVIELHIPQPKARTWSAAADELGVEVIYTHEHFYIINKPAGLLMHPTSAQCKQVTLIDWLLQNFPELEAIGPSERPAIVHRLDRETSGLLIVPRTNYAHIAFGKLFRSRGIQKTYLAIVQGQPARTGSIDYPIGRNPIHRKKMTTFPDSAHYVSSVSDLQKDGGQKARQALTYYKVLEYFDHYALVEVKPVTGRTHQIRVHMTAISHPLLGDSLYGQSSPLMNRQALHAAGLSFMFDGVPYTFEAPLPADFEHALQLLRG